MSVINNNLLLTAAAGGATAGRSVRFNAPDSAYLSRTPASAGNRKTWTWSGWVKRSGLGRKNLLMSYDGSNLTEATYTNLGFSTADLLVFESAYVTYRTTTQVFRDTSAWYHLVIALDTTQATASERIKIYVNGAQITTFNTTNNPSLNADLAVNATFNHRLGSEFGQFYFDGYLALVHFIDGQALTPSSFGETSATTGQWIAKTYSGSYGTNGFFLDFADNSTAAALGYDAAGSNDWTVNNLSVSNGVSTIASATGALPILNTDSTGATVQSGVRSDSNASFIKLAVACGTASGLNLTDQNVSGRSASNATITNSGVTGTTSSSKFYSGSANVTNGNYFKVAAHGDFEIGGTWTIEFWAKPDSNATGAEKTIIGYGINASDGYVIMVGRGGATFRTNGTSDLVYDGSITDWTHFAFVASSGTTKSIFVNGNLVASGSGTINASGSYDTYIGSPNTFNSGFRFTGEFQDVRIYKGKVKYTASFTAPNTYYPSLAAGNDSLRDHPTSAGTSTGLGGEVSGNYATLNPLEVSALSGVTLSNGNLQYTTSSANAKASSTIVPPSGKWYCELTVNSATYISFGISKLPMPSGSTLGFYDESVGWYQGSGNVIQNYLTEVTNGLTLSNGDVLGLALDATNKTVAFYKNGVVQHSPSTISYSYTSPMAIVVGTGVSGAAGSINFGQRAFAYTAPSGFSPLVDTLLPTPTIAKPNTVMDVVTYTGTGSSRSITGLGFSPDLVWLKARSTTAWHEVFDSVRGALNHIFTNDTAAESTLANTLTSFDSNGFSLGSDQGVNWNTVPFVGWCFDAGSSNATNTSGTITSTCRTNISAGFSIVSYVGNGGFRQEVGHSLNAAPSFILFKSRDTAQNWVAWHKHTSSTPWNDYLVLNSTAARQDAYTPDLFGGMENTSTVLSVSTSSLVNKSNDRFIAYCWTPVTNYSAFGTYTGNGDSNGVMIHTMFRPKLIIVKRTDTTSNWQIRDSSRPGYNVNQSILFPNTSAVENTTTSAAWIDFVSNGIKIRGTSGDWNASGGTYVYAIWAEAPFPYARAR